MPPNLQSLLSSEIFKVTAKSGQKHFLVHSGILAAQSKPLRSATGACKKSTEKKIDLSDWDDDAVGRFIEFLYIGDYSTHESVLDEEVEGRTRKGANTPNTVQSLAVKEGCGVEEARSVLLAHAKVYALAQYEEVEALRVVVLERLRIALEDIDWCVLGGISRVAADVVGLLEYVYSHTNPGEPIRELVAAFVVENIGRLMSEEMALLVKKGGDFAFELVERVVGRIGGVEKNCNVGIGESCGAVNSCKAEEEQDLELELDMELDAANAKVLELEAKILAMGERLRRKRKHSRS